MNLKIIALVPVLMFSASTTLLVNYGFTSLKLSSDSHELNQSAQTLIETNFQLRQCVRGIDELVKSTLRMEHLVSATSISSEFNQKVACLDPLMKRLELTLLDYDYDIQESQPESLEFIGKLKVRAGLWLSAAKVILGIAPSLKVPTRHAFDNLSSRIETTLDTLANTVGEVPKHIEIQNQKQHTSLYKWLVFSIVAFACLMAVMLFALKRFSSDINQISSTMKQLCAGDLNINLDTHNDTEEIKRLSNGVRRFHGALMKVIEGEKVNAHLAMFDPLTDIYNRRSLIKLVNELAEKNPESRMVVLKIDLDKFKQINDMHGHAVGDEYLKDTVQKMLTCLRETDIIARLGGDEFAVVLTGPRVLDVWPNVASRLLDTVSTPFNLMGQSLDRSICAGVSVFPTNGRTIDELLLNADIALYAAKSDGRKQCIQVSNDMIDANKAKISLTSEISTAIDDGQFVSFCQPKINIHTGEVVGFEALARWNHASRGVLSPSHFIELAESTNLILSIGKAVQHDAIRAIKLLNRANLPTSISINASERELSDSRFADRFFQTIIENDVDPSSICLEILESVALENSSENIRKNLQHLQQHGVKIWIDDFGVGFSTVGVLKHDFIHGIKIDRQFVCTENSPERDRTLLDAIVQMSRNMGKHCILEGVETIDEIKYVQSIGCSVVQGFYYAKPMPVNELIPWWNAHLESVHQYRHAS